MNTPRLALPLLTVAQSHKELTHNEALFRLDALVQPVAESQSMAVPANLGLSDAGKCWIVGDGASGAWAGQGDHLACWSGDDWRFVTPFDGMKIHLKSSGIQEIYINNQWVAAIAIADPAGGSIVDVEARAAISALLGYLRGTGRLPE
jgi:Protein of unknown function (DUF2793)